MTRDTPLASNPASAPILILGAGRNIGLSLARRLLADGWSVALSYRNTPDDVIRLEMDYPEQVLMTAPLDARTPQSMQRFFDALRQKTEQLYGLVNCIGPFAEAPLLETSEADFEEMLNGNLTQAFWAARRAVPMMQAFGSGRLVHFLFAGVEKQAAYREIGAYAAAKSGLLSLTRSLAAELAGSGITVNAIAPGIAETAPEAHLLHLAKRAKGPRPTRIESLYGALDFLLSQRSAQTTGSTLTVSDGFGWR